MMSSLCFDTNHECLGKDPWARLLTQLLRHQGLEENDQTLFTHRALKLPPHLLTNNDITDTRRMYAHVPAILLTVHADISGQMSTGGVITGVLITELCSWGGGT